VKTRRAFLLSLTTGLVALAVLSAPVIADELIGFISKVDVEGKKITVTTKDDGDKEISVTDDTEVVNAKGESSKIDLEKLAKGVAKSVEKNKKGLRATVTHEGGKASKIVAAAKKKAN
jgi:hypothetical protein